MDDRDKMLITIAFLFGSILVIGLYDTFVLAKQREAKMEMMALACAEWCGDNETEFNKFQSACYCAGEKHYTKFRNDGTPYFENYELHSEGVKNWMAKK